MVRINGADVSAEGISLAAYLDKEGFSQTRIAVERNGEIVPKTKYEEIILAEGDKIEIVSFVGGG